MIRRTTRRRPYVQVVSSLDVFTILLFYFMVFTTFRSIPAGVNINLPGVTTAATRMAEEWTVSVDALGRMYLAGQAVQPAQITLLTRQKLSQNADLVVTVQADEATAYENVVSAIDAARGAGVYRIRLAVDLRTSRAQ